MQEDEELHVVIYVDGSATYDIPGLPKRGANARISCAYIIFWEDTILCREFIEIGEPGTINQAEFLAAVHGINAAKLLGATHVCVYSDSQLVVNAVKREDGKHSSVPGSKEWTAQIKSGLDSFKWGSIFWIPRGRNVCDGYLSDQLGLRRSPKEKAKRKAELEVDS